MGPATCWTCSQYAGTENCGIKGNNCTNLMIFREIKTKLRDGLLLCTALYCTALYCKALLCIVSYCVSQKFDECKC